jgi:hypothetical protein
MPRKSAASLNVTTIDGRPSRPHPPTSLPPAERDLFVSLVAANPPGHFKTSDLPLLVQFCAAAVLSERATAELRTAPVIDGKPSAWLTVFEKASRAMVALSMRLRLSPQARAPNNPKRPDPSLSAYELMRLRDEKD